MTMSTSREDARKVKEKATALARTFAPVVGAGLTKVGESYAVKVNLREAAPQMRLPSVLDGVQIVYEVVGQLRARAAG